MKKLIASLLCLGYAALALAQTPAESYPVDAASVEQAGYPKEKSSNSPLKIPKFFPAPAARYPFMYRPNTARTNPPAFM